MAPTSPNDELKTEAEELLKGCAIKLYTPGECADQSANSDDQEQVDSTSTVEVSIDENTKQEQVDSTSTVEVSIDEIISSVARVFHKLGGANKLETVYEMAMEAKLRGSAIACVTQQSIPIYYRGKKISSRKADVFAWHKEADSVRCILELKAEESLCKDHEQQVKHYAMHFNVPLGLLINFPSTSKLPTGVPLDSDMKKSKNSGTGQTTLRHITIFDDKGDAVLPSFRHVERQVEVASTEPTCYS
ncbi:hypothetical protein ATCC90586_011531 [Pythium insidiosum]|nr:hypothetical protein ATCC90586_011531 [Pythium insidiosum]